MAKPRRIRGFFGSLFNVRSWLGYGHVKSGASLLSSNIKSILTFDKSKYQPEDFSEAVTRLNLSEQDIVVMQRGFLRNFYILFMAGLVFSFYSMYAFYNSNWYVGLVTTALAIMLFVYSMFSNFWFYQLKNKDLSKSIKEWLFG